MNITTIYTNTAELSKKHGWDANEDLSSRLNYLDKEVRELQNACKHYKHCEKTLGKDAPLSEQALDNVKEEVSDVIWNAVDAARKLGVSAQDLSEAIAKKQSSDLVRTWEK